MPSENKQIGFTLIEMLVTITVVSILITLSTPLSTVYKSNRVSSQVQGFISSLNVARSEAISRGIPMSICASNGLTPANCVANAGVANPGNINNWSSGWLVFADTNSNCAINPDPDPNLDDTILKQRNALATGFFLEVDGLQCINYTAAGIAPTSSGTWTLCDPSSNPGLKRGINISVSGRALVVDNQRAIAAGIVLLNNRC